MKTFDTIQQRIRSIARKQIKIKQYATNIYNYEEALLPGVKRFAY